MRGYWGIGVYHAKREVNVGTLWRSAGIFGADFIFTIGRRYEKQSSDTMKAWRHVPLYNYTDFEDFKTHLPKEARLVCAELCETAMPLTTFVHPERAVYLLGAEDHGLPESVWRGQMCVRIEAEPCLNVATAGSIVAYDRYVKGHYVGQNEKFGRYAAGL